MTEITLTNVSTMPWWAYLLAYLVIINIIAFLLMAIDKHKARKHRWRIPERALFLVSILGGSLGNWAGMYAFRHKTQHAKFVFGIPAILLIQIVIAYFIIK